MHGHVRQWDRVGKAKGRGNMGTKEMSKCVSFRWESHRDVTAVDTEDQKNG